MWELIKKKIVFSAFGHFGQIWKGQSKRLCTAPLAAPLFESYPLHRMLGVRWLIPDASAIGHLVLGVCGVTPMNSTNECS